MNGSRLGALDGLRGVAAVVVLVHHGLLTVPVFASAELEAPPTDPVVAALVDSPLHVLFAGTEAVSLFFVLSGLVLGLAAKSARFSWGSYFPSRLVRLYLPVVGAVALGALVITLAPAPDAGDSLWVQEHADRYGLSLAAADLTLVDGVSYAISPLWSLQWEVLFSLLLPVYLWAVPRLRPRWSVPLLLAAAALGARLEAGVLQYLPVFGLGVVLAAHWDAIGARLDAIPPRRRRLGWAVAAVLAAVAATSYWSVRLVTGDAAAGWLTLPLVLLAMVVVVIGAVHAPGAARVLASPVFRFLGLISFSLYLVHEPIVVAAAEWLGSPFVALAWSVPIAVLVAVGFRLAVERPAHRLARRIRDAAERDREHALS